MPLVASTSPPLQFGEICKAVKRHSDAHNALPLSELVSRRLHFLLSAFPLNCHQARFSEMLWPTAQCYMWQGYILACVCLFVEPGVRFGAWHAHSSEGLSNTLCLLLIELRRSWKYSWRFSWL